MRLLFRVKPSKLLLYSIALNVLLLLFGPADYFLNGFSILAASYLALCLVLFYVGLYISEGAKTLCVSPLSAHSYDFRYFLSRSSQLYIKTILIISGIACIYYLHYNIVEFGGGFGVAGAIARSASEASTLQEAKPFAYKLSYLLSCSSIVFLPLILSVQLPYQRLFIISILSISLVFSFSQLFVGNRNPAISQLFFTVFSVAYGFHFAGLSSASKKLLKFVLPLLSIGLLVFVVLILSWRQSVVDLSQYDLASLDKSTQFLGSYQIRPWYQWIYDVTGFSLFPLLYDLSFYLSHSFPFFLNIFHQSSYHASFDFVFTAPYIYVLTSNSRYVLEVVNSQAFVGLYPTAVHGFLMDFGVLFGPVFILVFGIFVGKIYAFAMKRVSLLSMVVPLTLVIPAVFPIYYISWGFSDMLFIVSIFHFSVLCFLGGVSRVGRMQSIES